MIPTLTTNRLILRPFCANDLDQYMTMVGDRDVMRFIGAGVTMDRMSSFHSLASILGHWALRGYGLWAVEEKATGALVGRIGFFNPEGWPGLEVGWMLGRDHWGKGYATEGAAACLEWGFDTQGMTDVISCIQPRNVASIAVAERLGQRQIREERLQGIPVLIYGMDRKDWQNLRTV
ncbi:MAG: GNAT family N-acetyltransferase [Alphaproteobacteria bacterium]